MQKEVVDNLFGKFEDFQLIVKRLINLTTPVEGLEHNKVPNYLLYDEQMKVLKECPFQVLRLINALMFLGRESDKATTNEGWVEILRSHYIFTEKSDPEVLRETLASLMRLADYLLKGLQLVVILIYGESHKKALK